MEKQSKVQRYILVFLVICSTGLFAYTCYRAATFPFTHDEALSYASFTSQPYLKASANNHILNTLLMQLCWKLFGNSEFSLRLPNLMAHVLYLTCSLMIVKRFQNIVLQLTGFSFLNFIPFVLDYFFLARGYGLALSFQMLSLYFILCAYEKKKEKGYTNFLFYSMCSGTLSVLANFTFLNFYIPLLIANAWLLFSDASLLKLKCKNYFHALIILSLNGFFLAFILQKTFYLLQNKQLYFGGNSGFIPDTVNRLIHIIANTSPSIENTISAILVGSFVFFILLAVYQIFVRKETSIFTLILQILVCAIVLPIFQFLILGSLFPVERGAFYYLPLYILTFLSASYYLLRLSKKSYKSNLVLLIPTIFAIVTFSYLYRDFRIHSFLDNEYEMHDQQVLLLINQDRDINFSNQFIHVGNSWQMGPTLDYYRLKNNFSWIAPITRDGITLDENEYIYGFVDEVQTINCLDCTVLARFADTNTILMRVNQ